jgi:pSer/pThr/pTyr-binding forkhead associated (FHA) protein
MGDDMKDHTPDNSGGPQRLTEEITQQAYGLARGPSATRARLTQPGGQQETREIREREVIVGSAVDSDLWADDSTMSRHHFAIRRDGVAFLIRDLGSTNGTFVDGVKIKEVYLQPGCHVQAGRLGFRFEVS